MALNQVAAARLYTNASSIFILIQTEHAFGFAAA
jgi:hypothetical protein